VPVAVRLRAGWCGWKFVLPLKSHFTSGDKAAHRTVPVAVRLRAGWCGWKFVLPLKSHFTSGGTAAHRTVSLSNCASGATAACRLVRLEVRAATKIPFYQWRYGCAPHSEPVELCKWRYGCAPHSEPVELCKWRYGCAPVGAVGSIRQDVLFCNFFGQAKKLIKNPILPVAVSLSAGLIFIC